MQVYIYIQSLETGALSSGNKEQGPDSKYSDSHMSKQALASADISVPWEKKLSFLPGKLTGSLREL